MNKLRCPAISGFIEARKQLLILYLNEFTEISLYSVSDPNPQPVKKVYVHMTWVKYGQGLTQCVEEKELSSYTELLKEVSQSLVFIKSNVNHDY